jgi:ssDNA-binding Zn-finger/Zn-ribbon topoisomerase 1
MKMLKIFTKKPFQVIIKDNISELEAATNEPLVPDPLNNTQEANFMMPDNRPLDYRISRTQTKRFGKGKLEKVWNKTGGRCWYCGNFPDISDICIDHQQPKSMDGSDAVENLVVSCRACNSAKGSLNVEEFKRKISREKCLTEKEQIYYKSLKAAERVCPRAHELTLSSLRIEYEYRIVHNLTHFFGESNTSGGVG